MLQIKRPTDFGNTFKDVLLKEEWKGGKNELKIAKVKENKVKMKKVRGHCVHVKDHTKTIKLTRRRL